MSEAKAAIRFTLFRTHSKPRELIRQSRLTGQARTEHSVPQNCEREETYELGHAGRGAPSPSAALEPLLRLVSSDMDEVNAIILSQARSEVELIPELANHLINSGGKRLRPMLTIAAAKLCGYDGAGHIKLAASVEFMHTATLLHDDVVDESDMRRGKKSARISGAIRRACWSAIFSWARRST